MNHIRALIKSDTVAVLSVLCVSWLLFNGIFFLGTHPTAAIDLLFQNFFKWLWNLVDNDALRDFLVFGLLTGIGGFLVYVPNIVLLFLFSHILYETGLSAKAARLLDPFFRRFGLRGNSFPPLLFGFGCSVNALHSAQTIQNPDNKLLTMLIAPFMSCGSKFGVYVLLVSIVFPREQAGTALFGLYFLGIVCALFSSMLYRKILHIGNEETIEQISTEPLRIPRFIPIVGKTLHDGWVFCYKAGTVIVVTSVIIWALSYWPGISQQKYDELAEYSRQTSQQIPSRITLSMHMSYLAKFGRLIEPLFKPLGQNWKNSIAIISSFAGRTVIISTLITLYGIDYSPDGASVLVHALQADETFSKLSALSLIIFILFCGSCLASITMFFHTTKSVKHTSLFVIYPIVIAWIISALFYQVGLLIIN